MVDYQALIENYANDSFTNVVCAKVDKMAQVIQVDYDTVEVSHFERDSFKELFYEMWAVGLIEGIDDYDYLIVDDFRGLADDLAKYISKNYFGEPDDKCRYIRYVANCNRKGTKAKYYYEWHTEGE